MAAGGLLSALALLLVCTVPSAIYIGVQLARGRPRQDVLAAVGVQWARPTDYAIGLAIAAVVVGVTQLLQWAFIPPGATATAGVVIASTASVAGVAAAVLQTLAEEILFRGLIAGVLIRRFGFAVGNLLQAVVFLLPHLLLIAVNAALWPIVVAQFVFGWLLGWLRHRSGSLLPGWISHATTNLLVGVLAG